MVGGNKEFGKVVLTNWGSILFYFAEVQTDVVEIKVGLTVDIVLVNNLAFPITMEYVNNDSVFAKDEHGIYMSAGFEF